MIGPLEIAIVVLIALLILGYRFADRLPGLGRSAGEGARELKDSVQEAVGDKADPKTLGQKAGQGLREAREFRDALTGKGGRDEARRESVEAPAPQSPSRQKTAAEPREAENDEQ
jgi:Sec-independent protein translocase protein TatA